MWNFTCRTTDGTSLRFLRRSHCHNSRTLNLQANGIVELPGEFRGLRTLTDLKLDMNPLRSPPPDVMIEGADAVLAYSLEREHRIKELATLLRKAKFEFDVASFTPTAIAVLSGEVGYLTQEDQAAFDKAVDRYVNGNFYSNTMTAKQIVEGVSSMRATRERRYLRAVIDDLLLVLETAAHEGLAPLGFFTADWSAAFGEGGEDVACYAVNMEELFRQGDDTVGGIIERWKVDNL